MRGRWSREWGPRLVFAAAFIAHPRRVASLIPSSGRVVSRALRAAAWDRVRVVVEYGPGVGTLTSGILRRMPLNAALVAVESERRLFAHLRNAIRDPRLILVHGSAADIKRIIDDSGCGKPDLIFSGLPLSVMDRAEADTIVAVSRSVLQRGGQFIAYQFWPRIGRLLRAHFDRVEVAFELWNVLPTTFFVCE